MKRKNQGFNSRLDESLGAKGKGRKIMQSLKDRRDESKGEEKKSGHAYAGDEEMDKMYHHHMAHAHHKYMANKHRRSMYKKK